MVEKHVWSLSEYVCCSSSHAIYSWEECVIRTADGQVQSKLCSFQNFPNHPQPHHRNQCGKILMKVKSSHGTLSLYPRLIYCYCSVIESLKGMIGKSGFIDRCEQWRQQPSPDGVYSDIYDGNVWKEFLSVDGVLFLSAPFNFALQLNVDLFQPFKHTQHAEGVIYLSILNLPRQERFLKQYILLVGVIPGPKEPALHINAFLQPLVDELKQLWEGVCVKTSNSTSAIIRAAHICVA